VHQRQPSRVGATEGEVSMVRERGIRVAFDGARQRGGIPIEVQDVERWACDPSGKAESLGQALHERRLPDAQIPV